MMVNHLAPSVRAVGKLYPKVVYGEDFALPDLLVCIHALHEGRVWFKCPANLGKTGILAVKSLG